MAFSEKLNFRTLKKSHRPCICAIQIWMTTNKYFEFESIFHQWNSKSFHLVFIWLLPGSYVCNVKSQIQIWNGIYWIEHAIEDFFSHLIFLFIFYSLNFEHSSRDIFFIDISSKLFRGHLNWIAMKCNLLQKKNSGTNTKAASKQEGPNNWLAPTLVPGTL